MCEDVDLVQSGNPFSTFGGDFLAQKACWDDDGHTELHDEYPEEEEAWGLIRQIKLAPLPNNYKNTSKSHSLVANCNPYNYIHLESV